MTAHQLSRRRFLGYGLGTVALSGVTSSCIGAVASTSGPTISGSGADPIRQRQRQRQRQRKRQPQRQLRHQKRLCQRRRLWQLRLGKKKKE